MAVSCLPSIVEFKVWGERFGQGVQVNLAKIPLFR